MLNAFLPFFPQCFLLLSQKMGFIWQITISSGIYHIVAVVVVIIIIIIIINIILITVPD